MTDSAPLGLELGGVFERVLDQAIDLGQVVEAMERCGSLVDRTELRAKALGAMNAITAFADIEYREYLAAVTASSDRGKGRRALRAPAPPSRDPGVPSCGTLPPSRDPGPPGRAAGRPPSTSVRLVLSSVGLVLLSGYGMWFSGALPRAGDGVLTVCLLLGAPAVGAAIGRLLRRSGPVPGEHTGGSGTAAAPADTVVRARQAWELALLERGVVPFLLGRLEEARLGQRRDRAGR
ncbi:hypothetical protein [Streptomyces rubradiris]|uniref:Uncharacterized protein n=1 Tax=Streptomyces rubradiris TaxID=285531 RepID=A0ABQ3R9D1_STRRR|nr:hypothetical protein [Streptomyces rubradiris]GHG99865.1 hypothetical protein GCM10018792_13620 [Streptomyces rubradiris]GHI52461.1 hypothetical protein Srubr_23070 [Streptomyces rubradiris]